MVGVDLIRRDLSNKPKPQQTMSKSSYRPARDRRVPNLAGIGSPLRGMAFFNVTLIDFGAGFLVLDYLIVDDSNNPPIGFNEIWETGQAIDKAGIILLDELDTPLAIASITADSERTMNIIFAPTATGITLIIDKQGRVNGPYYRTASM